MTKVSCAECGSTKADGKFCSSCGAPLPEHQNRAETTIRYSPAAVEREAEQMSSINQVVTTGTHLVVRGAGEHSGDVFSPVDGTTTIGRHQDSDIFLDDITVSRNHAVIMHKEDGYYIEDLGSLNGTYVNRTRVESRKLADGDDLQIGKYKLTFIER